MRLGMVGLGRMGGNRVRRLMRDGHEAVVYDVTEAAVAALESEGADGSRSLAELAQKLQSPRVVWLMIPAGLTGRVVDEVAAHLEPGDIIIDGGNEHYTNTERRTKEIEAKGLLYVGSGVSGGEEGALKGPSLMPGGSRDAWPFIKPIFQAIAAKVGPQGDIPCCEWVGPRGAGHYVKMVHNGIEYGDMQLICEAYFMMREALGLSNEEL